MMNLGVETELTLGALGYSKDDVLAVGCKDFRVPTELFWRIAHLSTYDEEYGAQAVASDLIIWLRDGAAMIRCEYDGAEWWHLVPQPPDVIRDDILRLAGGPCWSTIDEKNKREGGEQ